VSVSFNQRKDTHCQILIVQGFFSNHYPLPSDLHLVRMCMLFWKLSNKPYNLDHKKKSIWTPGGSGTGSCARAGSTWSVRASWSWTRASTPWRTSRSTSGQCQRHACSGRRLSQKAKRNKLSVSVHYWSCCTVTVLYHVMLKTSSIFIVWIFLSVLLLSIILLF